MKKHRERLKNELKNEEFRELYLIEKRIADIAHRIAMFRNEQSLTQSALAKKAGITQQQLSRVENGENCTIELMLKICETLNCRIVIEPETEKASAM